MIPGKPDTAPDGTSDRAPAAGRRIGPAAPEAQGPEAQGSEAQGPEAAGEGRAPPPPLQFDAILHPHRSLPPTGFVILMAVLAGVSFLAGLAFLSIGAWPVIGFFGLDALLVYFAFRLNYRSGRAYQTVQLSATDLLVRDVDPRGRERSWRFEPTWLRVELDDPPGPRSPLALCSHGGTLVIGAFLTPDEKQGFAQALRCALQAWRAGLPGSGRADGA